MKTFRWRCGFLAVCFLTGVLVPVSGQQADSGQSLGDAARKLRKDTTNEVKMTEADTKKLFESVDRIIAFAAEDTGMPKRAAVKRLLVSKADVEKYVSGRLAKEEFTQRFAHEELSMKKLGFLPRDFNLKEFLVKSTGQEVGDLALLYISRWKTPQAAGRFARFYAGAASQRYRSATVQPVESCSGTKCPVSVEQIMTEEGLVVVECWEDNSVIVSESFDAATAAKLRTALQSGAGAQHAASLQQTEIGLRLFEIPAFRTYAEEVGRQVAVAMGREARR